MFLFNFRRSADIFVECYKNHGVETLRLVEGKSGVTKNGKRTVTKRVVLTLGPLHRFDDGKPDYVKRLKQSFVDGDPLIDALLPYCSTENVKKQYKFTYTTGDPHCIGETKLYGNLFRMHNINNDDLQTILNAFQIDIPNKFFTRLELKSLKKSMSIF